MMTGHVEEAGSSAQGRRGREPAQKQRRETRGWRSDSRGWGPGCGADKLAEEWLELKFYPTVIPTGIWGPLVWRRPRMWQRLHTGTRENRDPQTIGLVREVNGGGREAKEGVEGRMVETGVGGLRSGGWMWGAEGGRQNGTENQNSLSKHS